MKIGCGFTCQNPDVVFLRPSTILNRRNPAAGNETRTIARHATRNAKTQNFPATQQQAPPRQPKMMRFPTAAATRAAAFVATRSTNNPAASSALRFSALRAMSAAAPGPKVRQFSHRPKGGPMQCNCKMMGSIDCFYSFCLQSSTGVRFERIGRFQ